MKAHKVFLSAASKVLKKQYFGSLSAHARYYRFCFHTCKHLAFLLFRLQPPDGRYPPDIRRISVTSRMGFVNFAKHIITEKNYIYWNHHGAVVWYKTMKNYYYTHYKHYYYLFFSIFLYNKSKNNLLWLFFIVWYQTTVMISINVIIFSNYMFCEVYKSHPWRHGYPPSGSWVLEAAFCKFYYARRLKR